jgi:hypothetical protein
MWQFQIYSEMTGSRLLFNCVFLASNLIWLLIVICRFYSSRTIAAFTIGHGRWINRDQQPWLLSLSLVLWTSGKKKKMNKRWMRGLLMLRGNRDTWAIFEQDKYDKWSADVTGVDLLKCLSQTNDVILISRVIISTIYCIYCVVKYLVTCLVSVAIKLSYSANSNSGSERSMQIVDE